MKKKFLYLMLLLVLFITPVMAEQKLTTTQVKDTQSDYENSSLINASETVNHDKNVNGSVIVAGNVTNYNGDTKGIALVAGNSVTSKGTVDYGFFAGNTVDVSTVVNKDALVAGNAVSVRGELKRDAAIFGSTVILTGTIGRDAILAGESVTLENATILGDARIDAKVLTIGKNVKVAGKLTYSAEDESIDSTAEFGSKERVEYVSNNIQITRATIVKARIISYASMLVVFAVLALLVPTFIKRIGREDVSFLQVISYLGYGLVFLILVPVSSVILMALVIGIPLALIMIALYIMIIYLSYGFAGYYVGKKIWQKLGKEENTIIEGLIGITLLYAVSFIPVVGAPITFLAYLCGIGTFLFSLKK